MTNKSKFINSKEGSIAFFTILTIFIIAISVININILILKDKIEGNTLAVRKLRNDSYIGIIYKHSVMKTQTSEWYRIEDNKLILMEERYRSQGAGLPTETEYKFKHTRDGFFLYDINLPFEEVVYRTGAVIANHRLSIDGKEENFLEFSDKKQAIAFTVKKVPVIKYLIWRGVYG